MGVEITTAKPIVGGKVFYFIQSVHAELGSNALLPAYRTGGTTTMGGDYLDEQTQQGRLLEKSTDEHSIDLTTYFVPKDPSIDVVKEASKSGDSVKIWRVVVDESVKEQDSEGKDVYPADFGYGKVNDFEFNEDIGDFVEVSYTVGIVGKLQAGKFPLTADEVAMLDEVYEYQNPGETTGDYSNIQKAPGAGG